MQVTPKPEAQQALAAIALPMPVDDRDSAIFKAVEQPGALRFPRVTPLSPQVLSNILWSTWGANRRGDHNTAREIDLYIIHERSAYRYSPRGNHLQPLAIVDDSYEGGAGAATGAPAVQIVQLIYVANLSQANAAMAQSLPAPQMNGSYYCADTGALAGKVYLFASAQGISAVPQTCDAERVTVRLGLRADQQVLFAQSIRCPNAGRLSGSINRA